MRFIPTRVHGITDYLAGIVLFGAPWVLGFTDNAAAHWTLSGAGLLLIISALMTDFEVGLVGMIPMPLHLGLDLVVGVLLVASPWLLGFSDRVWLPHVIFGAFEIVASLTTRTQPRESLQSPAMQTRPRA
ncbi:SPW repeat domain-containing protein [Pararoseomonas indoligenes]|uniref:SPW repeat protein n=1 Tax=Roseomonas indoligenes TaxID=2820811 RepID=A0A940MYR3_9PROT|nr:SPW repeat protein [Pararoseomonas indoligenes]MBP0493314.1 SPW repeat protein [Pararoseomonas indoligenes]